MKRTTTLILMTAMAVLALATGSVMKAFDKTYSINPDSKLGKAKCMVCHLSMKGGALNPYGKDVKAAKKDFKSIESKDSDGDGMNNGAEIKKDRNPGAKG